MIKYKFYCPKCEKFISRSEVHPVVTQFETTPKGSPREVIVRAFHFKFPNCKCGGDLKIEIFEGEEKQKKLFYSYDEVKSGISNGLT